MQNGQNSVEKQNMLLWFSYLHGLQEAVSFNTTLQGFDLLKFANANIVANLPSPNDQGNFMARTKTYPGFDLTPTQLTKYVTFEALLDHFNPLPMYVAAYIQLSAVGNYPGGSLADFFNATISLAFPSGSAGAAWTQAFANLSSVIPAVCFSEKLQKAVAATVDDGTKKVSELVSQIAELG